jgi:hypothetical protein
MVDLQAGAYKPIWKNRRRVIFGSLVFCAAVVVYIVYKGVDTRVNETIALAAFGLAGVVISSYVFGGAWDDRNFMESLKK